MSDLENRAPKRKRHHQRFIFLSVNGEPRTSAPCRGGWLRPTSLELALCSRPMHLLGGVCQEA
jgi:hypothetical protein